jgi:hypothetical protein
MITNPDGNQNVGAEATDVIALFCSGHDTGVSIYNEGSNIVSLDEIRIAANEMEEFICNIKVIYSPTLFLLPARMTTNTALLDIITVGLNGEPNAYPFKVVKSSDWSSERALELLCDRCVIKSINGSNHMQQLSSQDQYIALSSLVDLDRKNGLAAAGALLSHLQANVLNLENGMMYLLDLRNLCLSSYMKVDISTMKALQIFREELHPNLIKGVIDLKNSEVSFYSDDIYCKEKEEVKRDFQYSVYLIALLQNQAANA